MAIVVTTNIKNVMLDSLDATFNSGNLVLFSSSAPAAAADAASSGNILAIIVLPADAFAAASAATKAKSGTWSVAAISSGDAAYFRLTANGDAASSSCTDASVPRIQGSVTSTAGAGDVQVSTSATINTGQTVTVTTFTLST